MATATDAKHFAAYFKKDSVVLFPTDTVVGIGCRFDSSEGISKIRKLKGIVGKNPLAILISDLSQLDHLKVRRSRLSNLLMQKFWPGGLTLVLTAEEAYPCSGEEHTIGLRMPDSEFLRKIIEAIGAPVAATSVNLHGQPAAVRLSDVNEVFHNAADHTIDFEQASNGLPSTVVKIEGGNLRIIREGSVTRKEIFDVVGEQFESSGF